MVLATAGESNARAAKVDSSSKGRSSTKSRASRASRASGRRSKARAGGWYCCPCPLTALRGSSAGAAPCGGARRGDREGGGLWPAPAKFYCCRADLVAAMAREGANNNESKAAKAMDDDRDDCVFVDYADDEDGLDFDEIAEEALPDSTFREVFDRSHRQDQDECWQVSEPDLPYVENLPHQLDVGRAIVVDGTVLPDALGFAINLSCGAGDTPDIAFHLNPRLDRCYVARNSRSKGSWGEEQGAALGGCPFKRGQPFLIHILVTAVDFKISVDRMHFCSFPFRMPLSKVCRLEIHGDVIISNIQHTRLEVYPDRPRNGLGEHAYFATIPSDHEVPWNLDLPEKENLFIGRFQPNLSSGIEITIRGRMKLLPQSFYVNLQQGCQLWPHPNVHLHLNPRFAYEDSEPVVVVNGWMHGSWGSEQKYDRCRFKPGEPFALVIYVEEQRYRIMVDGLQQASMFHRAPVSLVDTLVIRGDVVINHVGIAKSVPPVERLPSPSSPPTSLCSSFVDITQEKNIFQDNQALSPSSGFTDIDSEIFSQQSDPSKDISQTSSDVGPILEKEEKKKATSCETQSSCVEKCSSADTHKSERSPDTSKSVQKAINTTETLIDDSTSSTGSKP